MIIIGLWNSFFCRNSDKAVFSRLSKPSELATWGMRGRKSPTQFAPKVVLWQMPTAPWGVDVFLREPCKETAAVNRCLPRGVNVSTRLRGVFQIFEWLNDSKWGISTQILASVMISRCTQGHSEDSGLRCWSIIKVNQNQPSKISMTLTNKKRVLEALQALLGTLFIYIYIIFTLFTWYLFNYITSGIFLLFWHLPGTWVWWRL